MEAALKTKIIEKIEGLPAEKINEVLDFIEFIESRLQSKSNELSDEEIIKAAEVSGSFNFLYDPREDIYTLEDGEPI